MCATLSLSVVIPHYFVAREPNLPILIGALQSGSRPPDEILIWNNDAPLSSPLAGARLIQSPWNLGCKARFLGALAALGEWILFQDNDVCARSGTVANLLRHGEHHPDAILSLDGRVIGPEDDYRGSTRVRGRRVKAVTPIDITLGRMELIRRDVLMQVLARFPFRDDTVMDDLAFSQAAREAGVPCCVVPCLPSEDVSNLDTHGVGLSITHRDAYFAERNRVTERLRAMGAAGAGTDTLELNGHLTGWDTPDNGA